MYGLSQMVFEYYVSCVDAADVPAEAAGNVMNPFVHQIVPAVGMPFAVGANCCKQDPWYEQSFSDDSCTGAPVGAVLGECGMGRGFDVG
jgi:hypothetical protein